MGSYKEGFETLENKSEWLRIHNAREDDEHTQGNDEMRQGLLQRDQYLGLDGFLDKKMH